MKPIQKCSDTCDFDMNTHESVIELSKNPDPSKLYVAVECPQCHQPRIAYDMNKLEDQTKDRKVRHFRGAKNLGGLTLLYKDLGNNIFRLSYAICSPEDNYSRKTGIQIAESRWDTKYLIIDITPGLAVDRSRLTQFNYTNEHALLVSLFAVLIGKRQNRKLNSTMLDSDAPLIYRSVMASLTHDGGDDIHEWVVNRVLHMVKWNYNLDK
ncbi:hypothetical protein [Yersinia phage vB_Yru_GN1]|uniref:Uncharacterized protein n=1 Tax=Yersinia phage vB_Yru_GN1 TaxID=3074381 RepID=A0AA86IYX9_9CAUD|nr:hypothetical protein [Yersinia phage vB_Yru_GN1]